MSGILNDTYSGILMNNVKDIVELEHNMRFQLLQTELDLQYVKAFKLVPYRIANSWCVTFGKNIPSGITGFGDTPMDAIRDFNKNFKKGSDV